MSQQVDDRSAVRPGSGRPGRPSYPWSLLPHNLVPAVVRAVRAAWRGVISHTRLILGATAVLAVGYGLLVLAGSDGVPAGTTVLGVDVGGKSRAEAAAAIEETWQNRTAGQLAVDATGATVQVPKSVVKLDTAATVEQVATNRWLPTDLARTYFGGEPAAPVLTVDEQALTRALDDAGRQSGAGMAEPVITYDGVNPVLQPGRAGQRVDVAVAGKVVAGAVQAGIPSVSLPSQPGDPTVTDAAARRVLEGAATQAVADDVVLTVDGGTVTVTPAEIAAVTSFRVSDGKLVPEVDGTALLDRIQQRIPGYVAAREAQYSKDGSTITVTPSQPGRGLRATELGAAVRSALTGGDRTVAVPLRDTPPAAIPAELAARGVTTEIATFTQEVPDKAYMATNLGEAARRLNGVVVEPGAVFSMDQVLGAPTAENGYVEGTIIGAGGMLSKEIGGGLSASATTMWTAAFFAGMERVEQRAHTEYIPRYTPGLEATLSWGDLDLKWRNTTDTPVYVTSRFDSKGLTVSLYGARRYDAVKAELGEKVGVTQPGSAAGRYPDCIPTAGAQGFDTAVQRIFVTGGRDSEPETFRTHYEAAPVVTCS